MRLVEGARRIRGRQSPFPRARGLWPHGNGLEQLVPAGSLIQCTVEEAKISSKTMAVGDPVEEGHQMRGPGFTRDRSSGRITATTEPKGGDQQAQGVGIPRVGDRRPRTRSRSATAAGIHARPARTIGLPVGLTSDAMHAVERQAIAIGASCRAGT